MENGDLKHKATYLLDGCLSYFLLKSVELSQSWEIVDGTVKLSCRQSLILVLPLLLKLIFKVTVLIVHRKKYIPNAQCCFLKIFFPWTLNIEHFPKIILNDGLPRWCSGEESTCHLQEVQEKWIWSLDWEDALEKEMATHSSILAWKVPWTEEPSRQFIGLQRVGHNWETACTHTHTHTFKMISSKLQLYHGFQWFCSSCPACLSYCSGMTSLRHRDVGAPVPDVLLFCCVTS